MDSAANDAYDPTQFARGAVRTERQEAETDSAGRGAKQQVFSVRLHTDDGIHSPPISFLVGAIWMDEGRTLIELPFSCMMRRQDGWQEGTWLAVIRGARLKMIFDQLCEGRRLSIHATGKVEDANKPQVDSVAIEPLGDGI
jgi:hypothetical protein